jgi:hypothetical protein
MSLFEYAQEVVSRKLEREKPVLSSMGIQPVMPTAQGGGLSSVQNSLNINGQPHRLAYINPNEEDLLKSLGGSGRKIDGIPAYYEGHGAGEGTSEEGATGPGEDSGTGDGPGAGADAGGSDNPDTFDVPDNPAPNPDTFDMQSIPDLSFDPQSRDFIPYHTPPEVFAQRSKDNLGPNKSVEINPFAAFIGLLTNPFIGKGISALGIGPTFDISIPGTATPGGYGDTGTFGNSPDADADAGTADSGGDIIIREKIAAVKQIPVEEVTVEEVQRAKRLTAAQRVTGTRLEDILDDIYGSGKGAGLLGIPTNNTGTA